MADSIKQLAEELMQQELEQNPDQFREKRIVNPSSGGGLSPDMLQTLGGLADAASTYSFMKRGTGVEGNPLTAALGGDSPERTGLAALAGLAATKAAKHLIGKKFPKLANMLAANLGAEQLSLAVNNTADAFDLGGDSESSFKAYGDAMVRSQIERSKRQGRR